jgi:hypothetical protein
VRAGLETPGAMGQNDMGQTAEEDLRP